MEQKKIEQEPGKCKKCGRVDLLDETEYWWTQGLCDNCIREGMK